MKVLKLASLVLFLLHSSSDSLAQRKPEMLYYDFYSSIVGGVPFPKHLTEKCTPLVCLLKVETDLQMKEFTLTASDNADSIYRVRLQENISQIDFESLKKYLQAKYTPMKQTTFYIPFAIHTFGDPDKCGKPVFRVENTDKMYQFAGQTINEIAIFLPALFITTTTRQ